MGLLRGPERVLDAKVEFDPRSGEPASSPDHQVGRFRPFDQAENPDVELPRPILAADRHRDLYVIEPDDHCRITAFLPVPPRHSPAAR